MPGSLVGVKDGLEPEDASAVARKHHFVSRVGRFLPPLGEEFVSIEAVSAMALVVAAIGAMLWANVGAYESWWGRSLTAGPVATTPRAIVNDGLMTLFFVLVGVEIKRELVAGELRDRRAAVLPVAGAIGGLIVPAVLFGLLASGSPGIRGWTIPLATDVALPLGVLALLGSRVPRGARLFLLELAIVDDIGTILLVALIYGGARVSATIVGVAIALLIPVRPVRGHRLLEQVERRLLPWVSFGVVPLFALANAGVVVGGGFPSSLTSRVAIAVIAGLILGKVAGITSATWLALRVGAGRLPSGLSLRHVVGIGALGAMSFTVSLFVATVAFTGGALTDAKIGLFVGSLGGSVLGSAWLVAAARTGAERPGRCTEDDAAG